MNSAYRIEKWGERIPPNPAVLRLILTNENFQVYHWHDQPGAIYGTHMHDRDQTHWVISGAMELTIERVGVFILEAGDRDFLPAGTYHSARVVGEGPVHYLIGEKI